MSDGQLLLLISGGLLAATVILLVDYIHVENQRARVRSIMDRVRGW